MKTVRHITLVLVCLLLAAATTSGQAPGSLAQVTTSGQAPGSLAQVTTSAQAPGRAQDKNLLRIGWGDPLFEQLVFYPAAGASDHCYTGHIFADYRRSLGKVVSVGAEVDFLSVSWTQDGRRTRNYDLSVLPTVRFTWLDREWVRLYSGLGAGALFAWNNSDAREVLPVFDVNTIGIQVGKGHWCGSVDLGFMAALKNVNHIFMAGSRLVSVGLNYRW